MSDGQIDKSREDRPTESRGKRECSFAQGRKFPYQQLSLDLESGEEKEQRHETVVDPLMTILGNDKLAKTGGDLGFE